MSQLHSASESARKGRDWILRHLQTDGSISGASDLRAYYKTPFALLQSGASAEADRVLDYVESRFLRDGGDLDGTGVPWFPIYRTYPHSWLCCGAMKSGRFELARALSGFIATFHNPSSGGFFADEARSVEEIMTTSMAGLASLWSGRLDLAMAAAGWLENLMNAQPHLERGLYTSWRDGLVTTFSEQEQPGCFIDASKPRQYYFQFGISAAFLSSLGDEKWLRLARQFLHASAHCSEDRYSTPQSGKIGWGAAWTSRLSRSEEDRDLSRKVAAGLCALQNDDGSWLATGAYGCESADPDSVVIDVTSEFVALQGCIAATRGI
ncbi:MAG: hypothetical protein HYZ37_07125 [Candidatus Solibacter usitatus]|nr:hypothetical protein [Candidatus Solibacter usitatus]